MHEYFNELCKQSYERKSEFFSYVGDGEQTWEEFDYLSTSSDMPRQPLDAWIRLLGKAR